MLNRIWANATAENEIKKRDMIIRLLKKKFFYNVTQLMVVYQMELYKLRSVCHAGERGISKIANSLFIVASETPGLRPQAS